jgi:hypothetical protein
MRTQFIAITKEIEHRTQPTIDSNVSVRVFTLWTVSES